MPPPLSWTSETAVHCLLHKRSLRFIHSWAQWIIAITRSTTALQWTRSPDSVFHAVTFDTWPHLTYSMDRGKGSCIHRLKGWSQICPSLGHIRLWLALPLLYACDKYLHLGHFGSWFSLPSCGFIYLRAALSGARDAGLPFVLLLPRLSKLKTLPLLLWAPTCRVHIPPVLLHILNTSATSIHVLLLARATKLPFSLVLTVLWAVALNTTTLSPSVKLEDELVTWHES